LLSQDSEKKEADDPGKGKVEEEGDDRKRVKGGALSDW